MGDRFQRVSGERIRVSLAPEEQQFLADLTRMLRTVEPHNAEDPASTRLHLPVYLDDAGSTEEWWRLMGDQLESARAQDRSVFESLIEAPGGEIVFDSDQAESLLRVINEGRLVLAARLGIQVASDFDDIDPGERIVLDYLHWLLEDLTTELSNGL
ncbi:MAG: DUF2017 family protein [Acidimicrobiia bacterium]|nr:DUF2017 family protein [Acidimicrobiia bacterium]MDH3462630.1 DUF2017 family protein [Acidimicrobiia bacterium]